METGNFQNFEEKKGFEIAYALFRLSTVIPHRDYQERLQKSALSVLEYSSVGSWDSLDRELSLIKKYLNIGEEMGMVNSMHSSVILGEIFKLHNAISGLGKVKELPDLDIAGIFS